MTSVEPGRTADRCWLSLLQRTVILGHASLNRRLLVAAALFIALALVAEAIVIGFVLHRFIQGKIDQRLDAQIMFLSSMLTAREDRFIAVTGNTDGPPFDRPAQGWYWQIVGPKNTLLSYSLKGDGIYIPEFHRPPSGDRSASVDDVGPKGDALHLRIQTETVAQTQVIIVATAPRAAIRGALQEVMTTLAMSLAALGIALVIAIVLQVRFGLRWRQRSCGARSCTLE